jgi:hypothetical protein
MLDRSHAERAGEARIGNVMKILQNKIDVNSVPRGTVTFLRFASTTVTVALRKTDAY